MRKFAATALILALTFPPSMAFANPNAAVDTYREASEAYQRGNFKEAASLLERAYKEDPNLIYKYNQILAYQGARDYAEALRILDEFRQPMLDDGRFDDINDIRAQLETALAEQTRLEQEKAAASAPSTDYETDTAVVAPPAPEENASSPTYPWILVGVGGAALVSSALFGSYIFISDEVDRLDQYHTLAKTIPQNEAFNKVYGEDEAVGNRRAQEDKDAQDFHRTMSFAMLGTGVVLVGTGLALWYFNSPGDSASAPAGHATKANSSSKSLQVDFSPYFSPESAGASMLLKF